jgi:hypothetical protein
MTKIVLEIENQLDLEPILAIVNRLNIRHFTNGLDNDENVLSEMEHQYRKEGLAKFGGILKSKQDYNPSKSEFYEI